jgi:hypothetical protein
MPEISKEEQINRSNRLLSLKQSAGWNDFVRICEVLVSRAAETAIRFEGWDMQQSFCLHQRAKTALEFKEEIFIEIANQIKAGLNPEPDPIPQPEQKSAIDPDALREKILREMKESHDTGFSMGNAVPPPDLRTGDL